MKKSALTSAYSLIAAVSIALIFLSIGSCTKDYFDLKKIADAKWTPKFALPMVYSSLTIEDIIKLTSTSGHFSIDNDKFVTLIYKGNLFSLRADELIQIPDNINQQDISVTTVDIPSVSGGATFTATASQTIDFNTGGQTEISTLIYKSGILEIAVNSNVRHNVQAVLTIPEAKKNGVPFSAVINLNYSGSLPVSSVTSYDLTDYTFDMTLGGTSVNQFNIDYTISVSGIAGNPLLTSDNISISTNFKENKFDKIFGYIGQQFLSPDIDSLRISLFDKAEEVGTFTLVDAKIKILVTNSYGIPINTNFILLDGYRPANGNFPLAGDGNQNGIPPSANPFVLPYPSFSQIGEILVDSFELNQINSNVVQVINFKPNYFVYRINSLSNPNGQAQNFVIDSSQFRVDMEVDLPLHGTAIVFTVQDTLDFEMPKAEELDSLMIRVNMSNDFPLEVGVQVYFVDYEVLNSADTVYTVLDSVLSPFQNIMTSGIINPATGKVSSPSVKIIDQWFDSRKLSKMAKSKRIFVRGQMTTANNGNTNVKIYSDYRLDVKLGFVAKLKADLADGRK